MTGEVQSSPSSNLGFTEHQLGQITLLAPFLEKTDLTEEDISYLLNFDQKNPNYNPFENSNSRISQIFNQDSHDISEVDQPLSIPAENSLPLLSEELLAQVRIRTTETLKKPLPKIVVVKTVIPHDSRFTIHQNPIKAGNSFSSTLKTSSSPKSFSQNPNTFQTQNPSNIYFSTMANPPTRMDLIVAARYAPLVLPHHLNALPQGDYLKYLPKFTGEDDGVIAEDHLAAFYSYGYNQNIEDEDVQSRLFVHILDGEARKWFRNLPPRSINGIEALDEIILKQWSDRKDYLYYITEFGSLKRKEGESLTNFTKGFKKVFQKMPTEVKPPKTTTMITYANAFDAKFALWLRVAKPTTLLAMQEEAIEVESNILDSRRLKVEEQ